MGIPPKADRIEQVAFGFMASKVLFCAIELGVFTELAKGPLRAEEIQARLRVHRRSASDFLDTLVALGMLERNGELYSNSSETDFYLNKPTLKGKWQCRCKSAKSTIVETLSLSLVCGAI
jgi:predicted transcriptional regulator